MEWRYVGRGTPCQTVLDRVRPSVRPRVWPRLTFPSSIRQGIAGVSMSSACRTTFLASTACAFSRLWNTWRQRRALHQRPNDATDCCRVFRRELYFHAEAHKTCYMIAEICCWNLFLSLLFMPFVDIRCIVGIIECRQVHEANTGYRFIFHKLFF